MDTSPNHGWDKIIKLRRLYTLGLFGFIPWMYLTSNYIHNGVALFVAALLYGAALYFAVLRELFKQHCPICGQHFFTQPGGIIYFVRCQNCKSKIGSIAKPVP